MHNWHTFIHQAAKEMRAMLDDARMNNGMWFIAPFFGCRACATTNGLMTFGWEILKSLYSTSSRKFELSNRKIACDMNEYEWMMLAMKRIPMALVVKSSRDRWKCIIILFLSLSRDMFDRNCCVYYFCSSFIKSYFVSFVFYAIFSSKFRNFNS